MDPKQHSHPKPVKPGHTEGIPSAEHTPARPVRLSPERKQAIAPNYDYVRSDLKLIGIIAGTIFLFLIVLSFFI